MQPLPLGSIRPTRWLENQLRIQANGLTGRLDEFWPDVRDSGWFGGGAEGWERAPYWLDGLIPLACLLDDTRLKDKMTRYIDIVISNQHDDGWLGPRDPNTTNPSMAGRFDLWSLFLALKVLVQYHDATGDERVVGAVGKCLRRIDRYIDGAPLFNWAMFRWFELLISIQWLYERTGEPWLLDLSVKIRSQGFDWGSFFGRWPLVEPTPTGDRWDYADHRWSHMSHIVNNAMALKSHGLLWRQTQDERDRAAVYDMIEKLDRHHGMVTAIFTGDECLAGSSPTRGIELCGVTETMYSLEVLLSILGDPAFGDRLEKIAFNALPATLSPDMRSCQYYQQVNQVECSVREDRSWTERGPKANIFSVDAHFGCCTANLGQGWPKFAAHMWMRTADDDLAAVVYAPGTVTTRIGGARVEAELETEYPFRDTLRFVVKTDRPAHFGLLLRIPNWAADASVRVAGEESVRPQPGAFHRIDRQWSGTTQIDMVLPMQVRASRRCRNAIAIERGPLVYSLKLGEQWTKAQCDKPQYDPEHADWEVHPTTPWNYALDVSDQTIEKDLVFCEHPVADRPFSPQGAPVSATVRGRQLPAWRMHKGSAGECPQSPVESSKTLEELTLIPYGCTNLRMTEFPTLKR